MKITERIKEKLTMLNFFSSLELLGIMGFVAVLVYCGIQSAQTTVSSGDVLKNPLSLYMVVLLAVGAISFFISNPGQDKLDKAQMDEWRADRKKALIQHWKDEEEKQKLKFAKIQTAT